MLRLSREHANNPLLRKVPYPLLFRFAAKSVVTPWSNKLEKLKTGKVREIVASCLPLMESKVQGFLPDPLTWR
jgi:hypothetical protein